MGKDSKRVGELVTIPVEMIEFREGSSTLWIHGPTGGTVLRLKTLDGKIISKKCQNGTSESHGDALIKGDLEICLAARGAPGQAKVKDRTDEITARCTQIADAIVPEYRGGKTSYSCTGVVAKRWQAAWDGACVALGCDPEAFASSRD